MASKTQSGKRPEFISEYLEYFSRDKEEAQKGPILRTTNLLRTNGIRRLLMRAGDNGTVKIYCRLIIRFYSTGFVSFGRMSVKVELIWIESGFKRAASLIQKSRLRHANSVYFLMITQHTTARVC